MRLLFNCLFAFVCVFFMKNTFSNSPDEFNELVDLKFNVTRCIKDEPLKEKSMSLNEKGDRVSVVLYANYPSDRNITFPKVRVSEKGISLSVLTEHVGEAFSGCLCTYRINFDFKKNKVEEVLSNVFFISDYTVLDFIKIKK